MAPEQIAEACSPRTDVYAVGLLLYELLAGTPAYDHVDLAARRRQATGAPPSLPASVRSAIDPQIVAVLERCLDPLPDRRPASALAAAAALPGGDPLAALAAGETPAPHVVAAAESGGFSPGQAIALFAAFVVGVVMLFAAFGNNVYSRYVAFRYSPEVLAARAEEVRHRLGYVDAPTDTASRIHLSSRVSRVASSAVAGPVRLATPAVRSSTTGRVLASDQFDADADAGRPQFGAGAATLIARSPEPIGPDTQSPLVLHGYIELEPDGTLSACVVATLPRLRRRRPLSIGHRCFAKRGSIPPRFHRAKRCR